jgi:carboxyl-terminal processing protease
VAFITFFSVLYQPAEGGSRTGPRDIYHQAWELVRDNFYDPAFSGQNWSSWEHRFDADIRTQEDAYKSIKTMLESLKEPYTRFLNEQAFKDENDAIDSHIVGIGINLVQKGSHLIVTRVIEESPAEKAGVAKDDELVGIDGECCVGFSPDQAAERIRGQAGTAVRIAVKRQRGEKAFDITRAEIVIHAVSYKIIEQNIGYIKLSTFISNDAAREFRTALEKLSRCDGLVIDMRDNPGGLLSNSLEIADMLLEGGVIVKTVGRNGLRDNFASGDPLTRQPIAVLVNQESASASEILAGALKDNNRGVVIGTRTYGKGLVQEINRLRDSKSAIHITVSKYLTPSGTDINKIGVIPDIQVNDENRQNRVAVEYLKEKIIAIKHPSKIGSS